MSKDQFTNYSPHTESWDSAAATLETSGKVSPPTGHTVNLPAATRTDPLCGLPQKARLKFTQLQEQLEDAKALARDASEKANELIQDKLKKKQRFDELSDPVIAQRSGYGRVYGEGNPSFDDAKAQLDKASDKLDRAKKRRDTHAHRGQQLGALFGSVQRFIEHTHLTALKPYDSSPPKKPRGESHSQSLNRIRLERLALEAELKATTDAPITGDKAKAALAASIEELASRGQPVIHGTMRRGEPVAWPMEDIKGNIYDTSDDGVTALSNVSFAQAPDALALVCWLHKDALLERLAEQVDAASDDANALTDEQRAKRQAQLLASILDNERIEAWHIEMAATEGSEILPRTDMDVRAFLGVIGPPLESW